MKKQDIMKNYGLSEPVAGYLSEVMLRRGDKDKQYVKHKGMIQKMGLDSNGYQRAINCLCDILKY